MKNAASVSLPMKNWKRSRWSYGSLTSSFFIKKDEVREPYDRSKMEAGVFHSCIKRPVSVDQINALVDKVESAIFNMGEKEVPSSKIGELLMDGLQDLDQVAYVRFASVYREFKDVNTFMDEIQKLLKSKKK